MTAAEILHKVHGRDIGTRWAVLRDPDPVPVPDWTDPSEIFRGLAALGPVETYLEVGSWLGGSLGRAADAFPGATLVAVDTWLGGAEHWVDRENPTHDLRPGPDGQPGLFGAFAANVARMGLLDRVAPVRLPSTVAAEVLAHHGITADVIYLDGSHSYGDVLADCRAWWPRTTRWLVGDDWGDPRFGVAPAVFDFMRQARIHPRRLQLFGGVFWVLEKVG